MAAAGCQKTRVKINDSVRVDKVGANEANFHWFPESLEKERDNCYRKVRKTRMNLSLMERC